MSTARWRQWHKLLGLWLGLLLLLVALSGLVLVFKQDLIELNLPAAEAANPAPAYSVDHLAKGLQQVLQHHAIADVFYLKTPTQGRQYWWLVTHSDKVFLFDSSGAPVVDRWRMLPIMYWLTEFHTEMLIHDGGSVLVTLLGVGCLVLMVAGLISWWPGRRGFQLRHLWLWPSRRGLALRQHRAVAVICLPLLLLSVITGAGMSVQGALQLLLKPKPAAAAAPATNSASYTFEASQLDTLLRNAQQQLPQGQITMMALPSAASPQLRLRFRGADEWHVNGKTNMLMDTASGAIKVQHVNDASTGRKILNTFYPLHASYGLPALYKALIAVTGLLTVWLGILGLLAWLRRRSS